MLDDEHLTNRLAVLSGRLAASFSVGHLVDQLRFLDVAVDDYSDASADVYRAELALSAAQSQFDDLAEAVEASRFENDTLTVAAIRFHYRVACAYAQARRVLDRLVVVAHELLPRTSTDLGNSHSGLGPRLKRRCDDLGLALPEVMLQRVDDLNASIKGVRDQIEHPQSPMTMRGIRGGPNPSASIWKVVRVGSDPTPIQFESASALREAIHVHVEAMVDLIEAAHQPDD